MSRRPAIAIGTPRGNATMGHIEPAEGTEPPILEKVLEAARKALAAAGGRARAAALSPRRRSQIARAAGKAGGRGRAKG